MLAVGLALSYHVLSLYYQRLICHNLPPREVIVSSFIPVGAIGMGGWALLNLAGAADTHVRDYYLSRPEPFYDLECRCFVCRACMVLILVITHVGDLTPQKCYNLCYNGGLACWCTTWGWCCSMVSRRSQRPCTAAPLCDAQVFLIVTHVPLV
jgi:hypothetical protein